MDTSFRSRSGDHGTMLTPLAATLPAIGASATTTVPVPMLRRKLWVRGASYQTTTVPVGGGTIVARLVKRKTDGTQVVISSDLDLETVTANTPTAFVIPSSTPETYRVVQPGELLQVLLVASGTVTTDHAGAHAVVDAVALQ